MRAIRDGDKLTLTCVSVESRKRCLTSLIPVTTLADGLSKLHSADDDAVAWLTNYGSP